MKLAFRNKFSFGYREKEVPIVLNIGTLEATCDMLGIEFHQIGEILQNKDYDFILSLLYQGYITGCKELYQKPKYKFSHAVIWHEYMSKKSQEEFVALTQKLIGKLQGKDKKKVMNQKEN